MADGAKIHYVEAGQGSPIVFIPGWTMAADIWDPQISYFSKSTILDELHLVPATLVC